MPSNTQTTLPRAGYIYPIAMLKRRDGERFLGMILDHDIEGHPFWETIELLQWHKGVELAFNCNSNNYTRLGEMLTHWMPEPPTPMTEVNITDEQ